jgi:hypothetical protein
MHIVKSQIARARGAGKLANNIFVELESRIHFRQSAPRPFTVL